MAATLGRKASEAVGRLLGAIKKDDGGGGGGGGGGGDKGGDRRKAGGDDDDRGGRCSESGASSFSFLDNMCGPMLRFGGGDAAVLVGESDDADDLPADSDRAGRGRGGGRDDRGRKGRDGGGGRGIGAGGGRRPTGSYDYDDETNVTDATGSFEDDDETYDDDRKKPSSSSSSRGRGRDRKPRSPIDSHSEATSPYSEFDDDTTQNDTVLSEAPYNIKGGKKEDNGNKKSSSGNKQPTSSSSSSANKKKEKDAEDVAAKDTEKLITQPLASGFAKRCYFTKAGIGRTTQHYEGLTLKGNTVLMLAAAMKLKGCPTICDEDLRRVEATYPNQFSRLPDELLLSSGWRRISKYCHFSHKPLPDGVPFFHSRKRCHPNGGFYFLLCSAVGMTRLMDVEPLNRDALAVLQTDFPLTCEKAPVALVEDPSEWTLVDKFCFFSGGPINVEEDVYYRGELGGTEIYMLAFLSPNLSPEELYRLEREPNGGGGGGGKKQGGGGKKQEDAGPLKSVAAVEEVESVYDLTDRDFDDLKLYHLGPCRALPPYLLHPQSWTKVLPPHFVAARDEALRIAQEWESRHPTSAMRGPHSNAGSSTTPLAQGSGGSIKMAGGSPGSGYVELGQARGRPPPNSRGGVGPVGPVYPSQYPGMHQEQTNGMDPNAQYYPSPMMGVPDQQVGYSPLHQHYGAHLTPLDNDVNYYYSPRMMPPGAHSPGAHFQQQLHMPPHSTMANPYGNPNLSAHTPTRMSQVHGGIPYDAEQYQPYPNAPPAQLRTGDPQWIDIQEEGAFGREEGGDQPDDEAIATRGGAFGGMRNSGPRGVGGMMHHQMIDPNIEHQYHHQVDPPVNAYENSDVGTDHQHCDDNKSVASGTSSLMGGAQNRLKQKRLNKNKDSPRRPDLSTKLGKIMTKAAVVSVAEDSWETRTDAESSIGTSLVSAESSISTNPNEKSSRRALILQMAKARMKNVKESTAADENNAEVPRETGVNAIADTAVDEMCMELD